MEASSRTYLPAAGYDFFLPFYDPLVKLLGGDSARRVLLDQAAIQPGERVLDIGCGTGTMVVLLKRLHPEAVVVGLDPDPKALARARRKLERAATTVQLDQGFSDVLPYAEASFHRVFSSFMFHHLQAEEKAKTLQEVRRVLKPGGAFHMLDFVGPQSGRDGLLTRWFHSSHHLKENSEDHIHGLMRGAGFADAKTLRRGTMLFWRIAYYQASESAS